MERLRPPIPHPEARDRDSGRASKNEAPNPQTPCGDLAGVHGSSALARYLTMTRVEGARFPAPTRRHLRAPDIELVFKAVRQLLLTPPELWSREPQTEEESPRPADESDAFPRSDAEWTAFRHSIVRRFSATMGQPARCLRRACRRNNRCTADPPDCWPDLPPLQTEEEVAFIQYVLKTLLETRAKADAKE